MRNMHTNWGDAIPTLDAATTGHVRNTLSSITTKKCTHIPSEEPSSLGHRHSCFMQHSQPITARPSDRRNSQPTDHVINQYSNDHSTSQRSQLPTRQRMVQLASPSCRVNVPCAPPCSTSLPLPTRTCPGSACVLSRFTTRERSA
jgi:hypothetical protein